MESPVENGAGGNTEQVEDPSAENCVEREQNLEENNCIKEENEETETNCDENPSRYKVYFFF